MSLTGEHHDRSDRARPGQQGGPQRQPGNPIGWLLLACAVGYALAGLTQSSAGYGQLTRPSVLPGVTLAAWAASWL